MLAMRTNDVRAEAACQKATFTAVPWRGSDATRILAS